MTRSFLVSAVALFAVVVVIATTTVPVFSIQGPQRQQDVRIPGMDVSLKAGWRLLFHANCRYAVPSSWRADPDAGFAVAPDGSNISIRMFTVTNWSIHKAQIKAAFGHVKAVHDDSDRRLWLEIGDTPRIQHYLDVANGLTVCSGLLEIRTATTPDVENTTKRIAESIGAAPEKWPLGPP
jgi:hypothetical protein